ncbi:hypothetical protein ScPMuIL_017667 [Solemya velum]
MDPKKPSNGGNRISPYETANWLSKLSIWWLNPLFQKGFKKKLEPDDLFDVLHEDESTVLAERLQSVWGQDEQTPVKTTSTNLKPPFLFWAVLKTFRKELFPPGIYLLFGEIFRVLQPYLIGQLVSYFLADTTMSAFEAYMYAVLLGLSTLGQVLFKAVYYFSMQKVAIQMKTAVGALVYRKILRISSQSLHKVTSGHIVNLMSTDIEHFNYASETFHYIWVSPIETAVILYLIYRYVGVAAFMTLVVIATLLPVQLYLGNLFGKLRHKIGAWSDKRTHVMNEIISGIKVIKMYCWEKPFSEVVAKLRKKEMKHVWIAALAKSFNIQLFLVSSRILALLVFIFAWYFGSSLSTKAVFTAFGWVEALRVTTFLQLFNAIETISLLSASLKRVQNFLVTDELSTTEEYDGCKGRFIESNAVDDETAAKLTNMTAYWDATWSTETSVSKSDKETDMEENKLLETEKTGSFILKDISLEFKKGELVALIGQVGAGKRLETTRVVNVPIESPGFYHPSGHPGTTAPPAPPSRRDTNSSHWSRHKHPMSSSEHASCAHSPWSTEYQREFYDRANAERSRRYPRSTPPPPPRPRPHVRFGCSIQREVIRIIQSNEARGKSKLQLRSKVLT